MSAHSKKNIMLILENGMLI